MIPIENFFTHLNDFAHAQIFEKIEWPWEPLKTLDKSIHSILRTNSQNAESADSLEGATVSNPSDWENAKIGMSLFVHQWMEIKTAVLIKPLGILIGKGTILEPSAILKGPLVVGEGCEIRQGAYIRGNVLIGSRCVIGHCTEIKNSIVMDHSEAGHFNYIGDSILGSHVNMGRDRVWPIYSSARRNKRNGKNKFFLKFPPSSRIKPSQRVSTSSALFWETMLSWVATRRFAPVP